MDMYIKIPIDIINNYQLSNGSKLLFGYILSLTKKDGFCYASNKHLSENLGVSTRTISKFLKELYEENLIDFKYTISKKRNIYLRSNFL